MKDFALLFRQPKHDHSNTPKEEMQAIAKKWNDWIGGIAAQGKIAGNGARLAGEGKVLSPGGIVTDGPFVEIREILGGFIIVKAENLEEATTLAHGCPGLEAGGSVEVRPVYS